MRTERMSLPAPTQALAALAQQIIADQAEIVQRNGFTVAEARRWVTDLGMEELRAAVDHTAVPVRALRHRCSVLSGHTPVTVTVTLHDLWMFGGPARPIIAVTAWKRFDPLARAGEAKPDPDWKIFVVGNSNVDQLMRELGDRLVPRRTLTGTDLDFIRSAIDRILVDLKGPLDGLRLVTDEELDKYLGQLVAMALKALGKKIEERKGQLRGGEQVMGFVRRT